MQTYSYKTLSHNFRSKKTKNPYFSSGSSGREGEYKLATISANIGGIDINQEVSFFVAQKSP
jgi:hypothetical protein